MLVIEVVAVTVCTQTESCSAQPWCAPSSQKKRRSRQATKKGSPPSGAYQQAAPVCAGQRFARSFSISGKVPIHTPGHASSPNIGRLLPGGKAGSTL